MLDFTSALYLGLKHPSGSLRPWRELTTGAPSALVEPVEARQIAQALAVMMGCEAATLATSTLHLAWDLFGLLAEKPITLFMDAEAYPITRWGVQRALMRGAKVRVFPHHDAVSLGRALAAAPHGRAPVIVTDGFCPGCGRVAPLSEYHALARRHGGLLVADDTQALGILGHSPIAEAPYGHGGGGSLRWSGSGGSETLIFSSLAKGLGVPVAVLAGSRERLREFEDKSLTRVHCSPPSCATLRGAEHALEINGGSGDLLRRRLASLVRRFRDELHELGISVRGGLFPIQTLVLRSDVDVEALHNGLEHRGLRTVLRRGRNTARPRLTLLLNAAQSPRAMECAASIIRSAVDHQARSRIRKSIHHKNKQQCKTLTINQKQTYERHIRT